MKNKNLESKIIETLKKEVIARDAELRHNEEERLQRETTKEALAEITALSRKELDDLETEIRQRLTREFLQAKRRRRGVAIAVGAILLVGSIAAWKSFVRKPAILLNEGFDNDKAGWKIDSGFVYKRSIEGGAYILDNNREDYCYWDDIPFRLPKRYAVELRSVWKSGKYSSYGVMLAESAARFTAFQLYADGRTSIAKFADGKFLPFVWTKLKQTSLDQGKEITQKITVANNTFRYSVNGEPAGEGLLNVQAPAFVSLRVCGVQTVGFTHLRVTDEESGAVLLEEPFDNANNAALNVDSLSIFRCVFQNGSYLLTHSELNRCHATMIPIKLPFNYDIRCYSRWLKGETAYFGLGLFREENSFASFELTGKGATRFANYENNAYRSNAEGRNVLPDSLRQYCQYIKIRSGSYEYFVNDKLVSQGTIENAKTFKFIGFRLCGSQSVSLDSLVVAEARR